MATRDDYLKDKRFISDARSFLYERTGDLYAKPEEVVDNFLEQRRVATVNEVSMLRDLEYAQEADDNSKQRFARLLDDFDNYDDGMSWGAAGDYAQGLATSPLTVGAAAASFGVGAIAKTGMQIAGRQAAMAGLRKLLIPSTLGGAVRGTVLGAAEGAATEEIYQRTREATGAGREEGMVGLTAGIAGSLGAVGGAIAGKMGGARAGSVAKIVEEADAARAATTSAQKQAVTKARALAEGGKAAQKQAKKEKLRALDKEWVAEGDKLLDSLNENTALAAKLPQETIEAVSIAAVDVASRLVKKPGQRITEVIADGIANGKISSDAFKEILDTYKITREQFSAVYMADISNAARTLQKQGQTKKAVEDFITKMKGAANDNYLDITSDEMKALVQQPHQVMSFFRGLDRLRLGMMTSQLATTVRNTAGGSLRIAVDSFEHGLENVFRKISGKQTSSALLDSTSIGKFMLKQDEAAIVQTLFEETMPTKARRLFFSAADSEAKITRDSLTGETTTAAENFFSSIGHKVNVLNTVSDNIFKRAVFSASLDRQLRAAGEDGLMDYIRKGKFAEMDESFIKKAMDDALDFTYQKMPSKDSVAGKVGNSILSLHRALPFGISSFVPFPRFLINQLKFVHDHSVILPLITKHTGITKGMDSTEEYLAKSVSGAAMYSAALAFRASQPDDSKWHQYVDDNGDVTELAPLLGPFSVFMIAADWHVKHMRGVPAADILKSAQETAKALGTPRIAPNSGWKALDGLYGDVQEGNLDKAVGKWLGEVVGTYTMPVAMLRDVAAGIDPEYRGVREMEVNIPAGDADFWTYTMHYASRNMPVKVGGEGEAPVQYSPTAEGPLKRKHAIEKQLFGAATFAPKTVLQQELDVLGMDRRDIMPYESDPLKAQTQEMLMGGGDPDVPSFSSVMASYIYSNDYQNLPIEERKVALASKMKSIIGDVGYNKITQEKMERTVSTDRPMQFTEDARIRFEKLSTAVQEKIEREWYKSEEYKYQVFNNPSVDVGMTIYEAGAYDWAMEMADKINK